LGIGSTSLILLSGLIESPLRPPHRHVALQIELAIREVHYLVMPRMEPTEELLIALRTLKLERRNQELEKIGLRVRRKLEAGKVDFGQRYSIHTEEIREGDLVLLHNTAREKDMSTEAKMAFRWLGP